MSRLRAELERVLGLCEKATAGLWYAGAPQETIIGSTTAGPVGYVYGPTMGPARAEAEATAELIAAAVNFLRQYGPALLTGQGEDGRDAARYRWLRDQATIEGCMYWLPEVCNIDFKPGGELNGTLETLDAAIDAATQASGSGAG